MFNCPSGPLTSTAEVAVSGFLLRVPDCGRSKNLKETSEGIVIAVPPIRDETAGDLENCRCGERRESAGMRKLETSCVRTASLIRRRRLGRRPEQDMMVS